MRSPPLSPASISPFSQIRPVLEDNCLIDLWAGRTYRNSSLALYFKMVFLFVPFLCVLPLQQEADLRILWGVSLYWFSFLTDFSSPRKNTVCSRLIPGIVLLLNISYSCTHSFFCAFIFQFIMNKLVTFWKPFHPWFSVCPWPCYIAYEPRPRLDNRKESATTAAGSQEGLGSMGLDHGI
jgi:hypothetical protein